MFHSIAEYIGLTDKQLVIGIVIFVIAFIILYIYISINEKKGINSQEKADVRQLVNDHVPDGSLYTAAYAYSKEVRRGQTMTIEKFYYYVIAFRKEAPDHLYVMPITVENGKIGFISLMRMDASTLSYVGGNPYELQLHRPDIKKKINIRVSVSNTKLGKECRVNIQQKEESDAYHEFAKEFQETVNRQLGVNNRGKRLK